MGNRFRIKNRNLKKTYSLKGLKSRGQSRTISEVLATYRQIFTALLALEVPVAVAVTIRRQPTPRLTQHRLQVVDLVGAQLLLIVPQLIEHLHQLVRPATRAPRPRRRRRIPRPTHHQPFSIQLPTPVVVAVVRDG
jgi:hypothetical protein